MLIFEKYYDIYCNDYFSKQFQYNKITLIFSFSFPTSIKIHKYIYFFNNR